MKLFYTLLLNIVFLTANAQKIDSIYVNLYTDSLKKGTYNYINVDGLLSNGRYLPLDSTHIIFSASAGEFYGNSLLIDKDFKEEKVNIKVVLRQNPAIQKEFVVYIKRKPDDERLKTTEEIMGELQNKPKKKKN
ncbi:MAG: hypothetical protein QM791_09910 [Ferruginibacter sp.]